MLFLITFEISCKNFIIFEKKFLFFISSNRQFIRKTRVIRPIADSAKFVDLRRAGLCRFQLEFSCSESMDETFIDKELIAAHNNVIFTMFVHFRNSDFRSHYKCLVTPFHQ